MTKHADTDTGTNPTMISRRGMVAGLGAAGLAGAAALVSAPATQAAQPTPVSTSSKPRASAATARPHTAPAGVNPIASPPQAGFTYTFLSMWDFSPEHYSSGRAWSPSGGVYAPASPGDTLWATTDLPPGAILGDVEWYISATQTVLMNGRLWVAGNSYITTVVADGSMAAGALGVRAARIVPSSSANGPYPHGTKLVLGAFTPNTGTVTINGARVGFKRAPAGEVLFPAPIRSYDSRAQAKIGAGATRRHDLGTYLPAGATGAILKITTIAAEKAGSLVVYSAAAGKPAIPSLNFERGATSASTTQTTVSSGRAIKITSTARTHYVVDLIGYLA